MIPVPSGDLYPKPSVALALIDRERSIRSTHALAP